MLKAIAGELTKNSGTVDLGVSHGWLRQEVRTDNKESLESKDVYEYIRLSHPLIPSEKKLEELHHEIDVM